MAKTKSKNQLDSSKASDGKMSDSEVNKLWGLKWP